MFLQICLLTAGLQIGRGLLRSWRNERSEDELDTEPPGDSERNEVEGEAAALPSAPQPPSPSITEEEAVREQFNLALVSTGLTSAAALFFPPLRVLGGVSVLYGGLPIMARARELVFEEGRIGAEVLDTVSMITTLATRNFVASSFMFLLYASGRKLRLMTEKAAQESVIDTFGRRVDHVWLLKDDVEVSVPLESLRKGDIVVVDAGSLIPADGVVKSGRALVDQHILTGESQPLEKGVGEDVFAATLVFSGRLHVQVETTGQSTVAAELAATLQRTADFTSALEAQGQTIADNVALPTLTLSALSSSLVGTQGSIALLNSSFLDSMRLFLPFSMLNYLRKAHDAGILLKDGRSLQVLPAVDTVIFDKTGTLTLGQLRVSHVYPVGDAEEADVLTYAAAAEHRQTHPIAAAILSEAKVRGQSVPSVDETEYEVGYGLLVRVHGGSIRVGSRRFMASHGIDIPNTISALEEGSYGRGCSLVYVAREQTLLGMIELSPTLRPEVERVLCALRARGVALYLLSGDHEAPTRTLAESLGFDRYFANVLPMDKARVIEELQTQGRTVCFVGDGINDAVALKKAAVSVSMGGASAAAMESAQITLLDHGLGLLPTLFEIADDFQRNVRNIKVALSVPAAIGIGGVFLAGFKVPAMTALYSASMASGVTVAMWPHRKRDEASPEQLPDSSSATA